MINVKEMKRSITQSQIISLMASMGVDYNYCRDNEIHFRSACHDSNSYKLYAYKDKEWNLFCHRCAEQHDIIGIVQHLKHYNFLDALNYVCDVLGIDGGSFQKRQTDVYDWQKDISMYLHNEPQEVELQVFDESVLEFLNCGNVVVEDWIKDSISPATQKKFGIGWYPLKQQIVIPVIDNNDNFVGCHCRNLNPYMIEQGFKYIPLKMLNGKEYRFPSSQILYGLNINKENIRKTKQCILLEAPKGVMQADTILEINNSVALFGMNISKHKRDLLIELGIEEIVIALDRQYQEVYNDDGEYTAEFQKYMEKVNKIINMFKGFCNISVVWDRQYLLGYKYSPMDNGELIWNELYEEREIIE